QPIVFYFGMQNCHYMTENAKKPGPLRVAAAIILGCVVGFILFFIIALGIGFVNDRMAMNIPVNLLFAENIWSAVLLVVLMAASIIYFCWKVWTTLPIEEEVAAADQSLSFFLISLIRFCCKPVLSCDSPIFFHVMRVTPS